MFGFGELDEFERGNDVGAHGVADERYYVIIFGEFGDYTVGVMARVGHGDFVGVDRFVGFDFYLNVVIDIRLDLFREHRRDVAAAGKHIRTGLDVIDDYLGFAVVAVTGGDGVDYKRGSAVFKSDFYVFEPV